MQRRILLPGGHPVVFVPAGPLLPERLHRHIPVPGRFLLPAEFGLSPELQCRVLLPRRIWAAGALPRRLLL